MFSSLGSQQMPVKFENPNAQQTKVIFGTLIYKQVANSNSTTTTPDEQFNLTNGVEPESYSLLEGLFNLKNIVSPRTLAEAILTENHLNEQASKSQVANKFCLNG